MKKPLQILLAEDNQGDVFLIGEALATHAVDHELHVVRDGEAALEYIGRMGDCDAPLPDLLLLDLNLPKIEGDIVLQTFRQDPKTVATPVIVVTSSDAPKDRERMTALGISSYFRKPTDLEDFLKLGELIKSLAGATPRPNAA